jgi:hypothetical protein
LENRLEIIEKKVSGLQKLIQDSHWSMVKVLIGTAATVIAGVLSMLGVIITHGVK